ncbi:hypothetical protein B0T13DRAFT_284407 [Neurospora crassa]|nr:hypothetical protein B0T13DRAFT_284407 [Neurospora crassa]
MFILSTARFILSATPFYLIYITLTVQISSLRLLGHSGDLRPGLLQHRFTPGFSSHDVLKQTQTCHVIVHFSKRIITGPCGGTSIRPRHLNCRVLPGAEGVSRPQPRACHKGSSQFTDILFISHPSTLTSPFQSSAPSWYQPWKLGIYYFKDGI